MIPYQLKPARSRLRLGRGGVVYLVVTGLIFGAAVYTQANLLFWSFGLMVGGLGISVVLAMLALRGVVMQRMMPSHGVADEPLVLRYQVANSGRVAAFGVMVYETWGPGRRGWRKQGPVADGRLDSRPTGWLLHLGPGQTLQAEAMCWPRQRGPLAFQRVVVESGFPFGVIHKVLEFDASVVVLVYPRLHRINRRLLLTIARADATGTRQTDRGGGGEEFFGLRPYRPGDAIKLIDWKHTASTGQVVVREMTRPSLPRVMILLDLRPPPGALPAGRQRDEQCERAISLAASLICDAYLSGYQIGLEIAGAGGDRFNVHHSLPHRTRMIDALARLDIDRLKSNEPLTDRPTVIVRPGHGEAVGPRRRALSVTRPLVLGGDDLPLYVQAQRDAAARLLRRTVPAPDRRERRESLALRRDRSARA